MNSVFDRHPHIKSAGKRDVYFFTVRGNGEFPFDMLRYDYAFPAHAEDWDKINPRSKRDNREVRLGCIQRGGPTVARWASFGWYVQDPED